MRPRAIAMTAPKTMVRACTVRSTPVAVRPAGRMPDMIRSAGDNVHCTTAEINKHEQKGY